MLKKGIVGDQWSQRSKASGSAKNKWVPNSTCNSVTNSLSERRQAYLRAWQEKTGIHCSKFGNGQSFPQRHRTPARGIS